MRIKNSLRPIVAALLAAGFLAGCSSGGGMPSASLRAQQFNLDGRFDPGSLEAPSRRWHEMLRASAGSVQNPCQMRQREGYVTFNASGSATRPYPGTFVGHGQFFTTCGAGSTWLDASFTITSGANTITGTITGNAQIFYWHYICIAHSKDFALSATLSRGGKVLKQWAGRASGEFGAGGEAHIFSATLESI